MENPFLKKSLLFFNGYGATSYACIFNVTGEEGCLHKAKPITVVVGERMEGPRKPIVPILNSALEWPNTHAGSSKAGKTNEH